jgi:hypothetical protein
MVNETKCDDNEPDVFLYNDDYESIDTSEAPMEEQNYFVYKETVCFLPILGDECVWCLQDEVYDGICRNCGNEEISL